MKKSLLLAGAALLFASCSKDPNLSSDYKSVKKGPEIPQITVEHSMLSFSSFDDYKNLRDELQASSLGYFEDYMSQHPGIDEAGLNNKIIADNFDPYKLLRNFEANYNYTSLRETTEQAIDNWLDDAADSDLDMGQNPDNHPVSGETERTLFNEYGELKIEDRIYVYQPGATYIVDNSDFSIIDQIRNGSYDWESSQDAHVQYIQDVPGSNCTANLDTKKTLNIIGGSIQIQWRLNTMVIASSQGGLGGGTVVFESGTTHRKISAFAKQPDGSWLRFYPMIERNGLETYSWYESDCDDANNQHLTNVGTSGTITTQSNFGVIVATSPYLNTAVTVRASTTENIGKYKWNSPFNGTYFFNTYMN